MPRIRTIKPEFWRSPDVMELDYFQRLLFIGLWNLADDMGRGVFSPEAIAADLFLSEYSLNPHGVLTEVSNAFAMYDELDMVQVYVVGRRKYFQIQNWGEHQKINRASNAKFPSPDQGEPVVQCVVTDDSVNTHGGLTEGSVRAHDRNREQGTGNREQGNIPSTEVDETKPTTTKRKRHNYPPEFEQWWKLYPRHVGKPDALKAWKQADVTEADLNTLTRDHAHAWREAGTDTNFIPHPATWLRREGWNDEPAKPTAHSAHAKPRTDLDDFLDNGWKTWGGKPTTPQAPQNEQFTIEHDPDEPPF